MLFFFHAQRVQPRGSYKVFQFLNSTRAHLRTHAGKVRSENNSNIIDHKRSVRSYLGTHPAGLGIDTVIGPAAAQIPGKITILHTDLEAEA